MPLVGFRPTKARLVIEDTRDSVLVMRCVVDPEDGVELASGGTLETLSGVLRIRERSGGNGNGNGRDKPLGTLTFVPDSDSGGDTGLARFQVSVHLSVERFATVMRAINAGHLPAKFFVDVGARGDRSELPGFSFRSRGGLRIKHWDNVAYRVLPVSSCVMIMALDAPMAQAPAAIAANGEAGIIAASNAHVAELVDDLLVFQADTRTTMMGFAAVLGVVAAAALAIALVLLIR